MQNPPPNQQYGTPYSNTTSGGPMTPTPGGPGGGKTSMGLDANVAAGLCYATMFVCLLGIIISLVFFFTEKTNKFVRFHAMQALLLVGAGIILRIAVAILGLILYQIGLGFVATLLGILMGIVGLLLLVVLIITMIKAFQGQMYKIPVLGDIAENIAGK